MTFIAFMISQNMLLPYYWCVGYEHNCPFSLVLGEPKTIIPCNWKTLPAKLLYFFAIFVRAKSQNLIVEIQKPLCIIFKWYWSADGHTDGH